MWELIADTTSFFRPLCRLSLTSSANSPKGGSNSASEVRLCSRAYQKTDWLSEISSHIPIILLLLKYGAKTRGVPPYLYRIKWAGSFPVALLTKVSLCSIFTLLVKLSLYTLQAMCMIIQLICIIFKCLCITFSYYAYYPISWILLHNFTAYFNLYSLSFCL